MRYVKLTVSVLLGLYAVGFVVFNSGQTSDVWLFPWVQLEDVPTLVVIVVTAVLSVALTWVGRQIFRLWRRRAARDEA
ncbi:MAG: hypothetical protein OER86_10935 [Phycisphaerae bacterium]|nr:hypothetical protein [Phycisphaerae bacterium]